MELLDGRLVSKLRLEELGARLANLKSSRAPGLCVIRVGDDPASEIYVKKKIETCQKLGFFSKEEHLPGNTSQEAVVQLIKALNQDPQIDGILLQLPLPSQLDSGPLLELVDPAKDVDGFHPYNLGLLAALEEGFVPCTPLGIQRLLEHYKIEVAGKRAVVVGRSRIVGRPMSLILDKMGATVTVIHSRTPQPREITSAADLLIVAAGVKHLIGPDDVKEGACVVDVGIHRLENGKLTGDVDFEGVKEKASFITPVPGGVGPMTICSLLENTLFAFERKL